MTLFELAALIILVAAPVGAGWAAAHLHPWLYYPTVAAVMLVFIGVLRAWGGKERNTKPEPGLGCSATLLVIALSTVFSVDFAARHGPRAVALAIVATPVVLVVIMGMLTSLLDGLRRKPDDRRE
ncbi:MAG TPA: hypothetical protein VD997_08890 [Phycisphaerales bacterium]|nr:hypothetical protein [Phycisphaerales bacterium]